MTAIEENRKLAPGKFQNPGITATGEARAFVDLQALNTLWVNTGTVCNIACANCYMESSPRNDQLVYISKQEVAAYLDEIADHRLGTSLIGFTGGEPFMNPDFISMLADALDRGHDAIVLTNAMLPMWHKRAALLELQEAYGERLIIRVSIDHYTRTVHENERGPRTWEPMIRGLRWLGQNDFTINVASRNMTGEPEAALRAGFRRLLSEHDISIDSTNPVDLVIFPEMDETADVPEITTRCWTLLSVSPEAQMCATARMVVQRKGDVRPAVVACTLLPYDPQFELGNTLTGAAHRVQLNHPHCAQFCVLGGASCA